LCNSIVGVAGREEAGQSTTFEIIATEPEELLRAGMDPALQTSFRLVVYSGPLEAVMKVVTGAVAGIFIFGIGAWAQDTEKKVKMQDLPPAVQQAVKAESRNATLQGLATEVEDGKTVYEAEFKVAGHGKDITFDVNGKVVSTEEEIDIAKIPAPAGAALKKAASGGKLLLVEAVTEGTSKFYEAQIEKAGKKSEVQVDAAGKVVKK
jgi:hypothetical protein